MTCSRRIFPLGGWEGVPMWGLTAPIIGHAAECLVLRQAPSQSSHWNSTANLSMLKPSAHVFHEMSICPRSHIGSGACDRPGTQINRPTGGVPRCERTPCLLVIRRGTTGHVAPRNCGEATGMDSSSHACLFDGTLNMEQTRRPGDRVSFHITSRHPLGPADT